MKDDSVIKRIRITKLNSSNYQIQTIIIQAIIKAKDTQETIELLEPEAETPVKSIDNRIIKSKGNTD